MDENIFDLIVNDLQRMDSNSSQIQLKDIKQLMKTIENTKGNTYQLIIFAVRPLPGPRPECSSFRAF